MTVNAERRAVIEALGLTATDLRALADVLDAQRQVVLVRDLVGAVLAELPRHHRYVKSLRRLERWAGNRDADSIEPAEVATWARQAAAEARSDPKARHGVGAQEAFVLATRAAYAHALGAGAVRHNPASDVELPERPATRRTALTSDQLAQARLALLAHSRDPELDDLVFQLLRETACRRAGAIRLVGKGLAPASRTVLLVEKYDKQRWVPTSAHLMARLTAHADARSHPGCDRVLHRRDGGHLNDKWFEGFAERMQQLAWAREVGLSAHWLRHTTLTDIERIAGVRVAGAYAGHSHGGSGVTGTYTKPSLDDLRAAHARLFFDDDRDADNPAAAPDLFRRARLATLGQIEFAPTRGGPGT